jgi:lipopolysaccharide transport system ATP-binding protein
MKPIIKVEHLSKKYRIGVNQPSYGTLRDTIAGVLLEPVKGLRRERRLGEIIWALKDVSFEIMPGEVVGIIGRNGAGKSTLLKVLSRITEPTEGRLELYGRVASLLEVGTGFHPELTGRENIYLNGAILGMRREEIQRKFDEIVSFAEVEKFLDTPVKRYSSGMYMRLAFAIAAHLEPEILIVDEVLAVGDAAFQKKCLGKMSDVAKEGRTVLFVSHNTAAIQRLCSKCMLFSSGRLLMSGVSMTVVQEYLALFQQDVLFNAPSTAGEDCQVSVRVLDGRGTPSKIWRYGEELRVEVTVFARKPLRQPAVDIAFHSGGRTRLFALQSDRMVGGAPSVVRGRWILEFRIKNPGFTVSEIYFDVGIRLGRGPYFLLIDDADWISPDYASVPEAALMDCILYPQADVKWKAEHEG